MDWRYALEHGPLRRFEDWKSVPREPGVYTIWDQGRFIYVGIAERKEGLRGRLGMHASGKRGNDQFNVYVADRFVLPQLEQSQIDEIAAGAPLFDDLVKDYVRERLGFRFHVCTPDDDAPSDIEKTIKVGKWPPGKPGSPQTGVGRFWS